MAGILFQKAKDEGCNIQVNWQDQDSSSEKSFRCVFSTETSARVMKCGGHVGRSHALKQQKTIKDFDAGFIAKHQKDFPAVATVTCNCKGKKHSAKCGCISDAFIESAWRNLYCAITQCGNDSDKFAQRMRELGRYHARGIHKWKDGECSFHPPRLCSCGDCDDEDDLKCPGKEYVS